MKQIPLTQGEFALVDDSDYEFLMQWKWQYHSAGYARRDYQIDNKKYKVYMHRVIIGVENGLVTDHINGNKLDNRKENLRLCSQRQNSMNSHETKNSSSKFKGVSLFKRDSNWSSGITVNGKKKHLGYFLSETDAAAAYNEAAIKYFGEFAKLNEVA